MTSRKAGICFHRDGAQYGCIQREGGAMVGSLEGVRVLELARYQAGPRGGMIMSDLGAEVIKIEKLGGEETRKSEPLVRGQSVYFSVYNRGKKSLCLDLRTDKGKEIFAGLVKTADVVLENFRPGTMAKMGFAYEDLCKIKPDIILTSVSAYGQYGPYRERPGFDPLGQAMSGLMDLTGKPVGKPLGAATSLVDRYTSLHATIGTLAALHHRDKTGQGQLVDCCLMDSALTMVEIPTSYYLATGEEGGEAGRPPYKAKDGYVVISASGRAMATRLIQIATGDPNASAAGYTSRVGQDDPRKVAVGKWCAENTVDHIVKTLLEAEIPVAPVKSIPQVAVDPHLWEREMLVKMPDAVAGEMYLPGATIKMSKTPGRVGHVPTPGEHTDAVLSGILGYDMAKLAALRAEKVIA
jgi:crotonobetainyl-CoA:carnitine CoA-transferase CaiB-like acyl-CoA transferase